MRGLKTKRLPYFNQRIEYDHILDLFKEEVSRCIGCVLSKMISSIW